MASRCLARPPYPPCAAPQTRWSSSRLSLRPARSGASRGRDVVCAVSFRPCIDIHKGKVKQIVGSTLRDASNDSTALVTNFESDKSPAEFANIYKEDGTCWWTCNNAWCRPCKSVCCPGSTTCISWLTRLVELVGKQRLVLDLSCRKKDGRYAIVTDRWQKFSDVFVDGPTLEHLAAYADEFLVHGVDVEGKRLGIDEEHVALLGRYSPLCRSLQLTLGVCLQWTTWR